LIIDFFLAYRIDSNDEPTQALFRKYGESGNDEEKVVNFKQAEDYNSDNTYFIPCHRTSSYVLCNKLDQLSRRDTGFLRFGRKR
jgi:hypothetical protein